MLKSSSCDYSDAYILVMRTIEVENTAVAGLAPINNDKEYLKSVLKKVVFTDCIIDINNAQIDNVKDVDIVMVMYKLYKIAIVIQNHQEVYGNTIEMKQQPMLVTTDVIDNFPGNSASFKLKQKITGKAENNGT